MDKFLVVDFETTGNRAKEGDQIIQIGAVRIENKQITHQFSSLVNPGIKIPPFIQQLTGITDELVDDAPYIEELLPQLLPLLEDVVFVGHNVFFDLGFLQQALSDCGYLPFAGQVIDTVELSRLLLPEQSGYRLSDLSFEFEIEHENPHQADSDALATAQIFLALLDKLDHLPLPVIQRLSALTSGFSTDVSELIRFLERSRFAKATLYEEDQWDYYRGFVLQDRKNQLQCSEPSKQSWSTYEEFITSLDLLLPQLMPDFELRVAQREMMVEIHRAFEDSSHLLIEAGTGTGKSLAYLVPSLYWAQVTGEKVVVSTHTIQLQEQLFLRDLPLLRRLFGEATSIALIKGRNNYLCLRKFENSFQDSLDNYDIQLSKGQILTWLTHTQTGDVEEINLPSGGRTFLHQVQSDANSCLNRACPWFSRCYYHTARQTAQDSDVIITNHSLLLTDLQTEQRILPAYRYAVIDEAHHFEDVASHLLGHSLSSIEVDSMIQQIVSDKGQGICDKLDRERAQSNWSEGLFDSLSKARIAAWETRSAAKDLFSKLYQWGMSKGHESADTNRPAARIQPESWNKEASKTIFPSLQNVLDWIRVLGEALSNIYNGIQGELEISYSLRGILSDLGGLIKECAKQKELLSKILQEQDVENVYWMELEARTTRRGVYLYMVPIQVAPLLKESFFTQKNSVVLTSATLSVNRSFSYSIKKLGLENSRVQALHYPSPFDYNQQTLLCVPSDLPSIKTDSDQQFLDGVARSLKDLAMVTGGRMLVLFTSYQMLRQVYDRLKESIDLKGYTILGHNIDSSSRTKLTKQFKSTANCLLLGTNSFWEGVDIPGEALSCLVIVRLPFWPPNHPVAQARGDFIKTGKGNPFMEMSVPQAVIRFKQGFGRLVRTKKDRGIVVILDKRIIEARYGTYFLRSLPEIPLHYRPFPELLSMVGQWLGKG
ncbi:MAG TPA: ATP-dependent DNA helicase DinG [Bacillota bacterium]|nr:ATP-dependent DNA helicase DinG [Bacillota bacterium]